MFLVSAGIETFPGRSGRKDEDKQHHDSNQVHRRQRDLRRGESRLELVNDPDIDVRDVLVTELYAGATDEVAVEAGHLELIHRLVMEKNAYIVSDVDTVGDLDRIGADRIHPRDRASRQQTNQEQDDRYRWCRTMDR